jgi:hypothetical protein
VKFVLKKTLLCLALTVTALAAPVVSAADAAPAAPRIYIDTLNMTSPQASAETFVKAFARSDYFAVFKLLTPEAQRGFTESVYTLDLPHLLPEMKGMNLTGSTYFDMRSKEDVHEVAEDQALLFDDIMMAAQRLYILPFTLGANAKVGKAETRDGHATAQVVTEGQPPALTLQLARTTSGRWKVDRIVWPGSSGDDRPWGSQKPASTEVQALRPAPQSPRIYLETLDMKSPEATATGFLKAYARSDYFAVHQMLSPTARDGFMEGIFGYGDVKLIPRMKDTLPGSALFDRKDDSMEVINDGSLSFDDVLFAAQKNDILPFTIGPAARLGKVDTRGKTSTVAIVTDGKPTSMEMELRHLPSGRWKVEQVRWEGSSATTKPWGAAHQK